MEVLSTEDWTYREVDMNKSEMRSLGDDVVGCWLAIMEDIDVDVRFWELILRISLRLESPGSELIIKAEIDEAPWGEFVRAEESRKFQSVDIYATKGGTVKEDDNKKEGSISWRTRTGSLLRRKCLLWYKGRWLRKTQINNLPSLEQNMGKRNSEVRVCLLSFFFPLFLASCRISLSTCNVSNI